MKSAFLEVTRKCNLACLFCSNKSSEVLEGEFSTSEIFDLVDNLREVGVEDLRFYGGEPFLRNDLFEIIERIHSYMNISIYTNGTILNENILKSLKKNNIKRLFVSVDSAFAYIHDKIRGVSGSFQKVIDNIKILTANGLNVVALLTICRINKEDIKSTYRLLGTLGVNDVKANFVSYIGKARENWDELSLTTEETKECISDIKDAHKQLFGHVPVRSACLSGIDEMFIASNGDVFPCALFLDKEYLAGNIRNRSLKDILVAPDGIFDRIRQIVKNQEYCSACIKKNICMGGCRARAAVNYGGNLLAPDITSCMFHKEII